MTDEMKAKIKAMQTKRASRGDVWMNANGTWSHSLDANRQFSEHSGAETDFRFSKDWFRGRS